MSESKILRRIVPAVALAFLSSCSVSISQPLSLTASSLSVPFRQDLQFTASGGTAPYTFSVASGGFGSISSSGLYTRPWSSSSETVMVTDSTGSQATATVSLPASILTLGAAGNSTLGVFANAMDSDGNIYFGGSITTENNIVSGLGATFYGSPGTVDLFVAKVTSAGKLAWVTGMGKGTGNSINPNMMTFQSNNTLVIAGSCSGLLSQAPISGAIQIGAGGGTSELFVAKLDPATGKVNAYYEIGAGASTSLQVGNGIYYDTAGNFFIEGGITSGSLPITTSTFTGQTYTVSTFGSGGTQDAMLLKFDSSMNLISAVDLGISTRSTRSSRSYFDSDGSVAYLAGTSTGVFSALSNYQAVGTVVAGKQNAFLASFNLSNTPPTLNWIVEMGANATTAPTAPAYYKDASSNPYILIAGTTSGASGALGTQVGTHGSQDYFLLKFDLASGVPVQKYGFQVGLGTTATGKSSVGVKGILPDSSGNVYLLSLLTDTATITGGDLGYLTKLDSSGSQIWQQSLASGTGNTVNLTRLMKDPVTGYLVVLGANTGTSPGTTLGTMDSTHGVQDILIGKWNINGVAQ